MSTAIPTSWLTLTALVVTSVLIIKRFRKESRTTKLRGPPRGSLMFGQMNNLVQALDGASVIQDTWAEQYGSVYRRPGPFGMDLITLMDPKAIAHFYAGGETTYHVTSFAQRFFDSLVGRGILSAQGDDHKRQRRAMNPGFTNAKLREYTGHFFETAHKVEAAWDQLIQNSNSDHLELNITPWMNAISLDSIGTAGFGHDFGATRGETSGVGKAFDAFIDLGMSLASLVAFLLQTVLPIVSAIPSERTRRANVVREECGTVARLLLQETKEVESTDSRAVDRMSILGLASKSQTEETGLPMNEEEVNALMRTLMMAGYFTTAVTLTWGLVELAKRPDIQDKLRNELKMAFPSSDPSWDQLVQELPILDAVVHETLRLHAIVDETVREVVHDDIIPLSQPLALPDGSSTSAIFVEKGSSIVVPIAAVNQMRGLWGEDAHEFKPERWLNGGEGLAAGAKELQGHRHLLTFISGPRTCLGKNFAVAEIKAAYAVLLRAYAFEFAGGLDTKVAQGPGSLIPRPTAAGEPNSHVPMRIARVESL